MASSKSSPAVNCFAKHAWTRVANGPEQRLALVPILGLLPEAFPRKRALGVLLLVDLSMPTFVGPGGCAKANER